MNEIIITDFNYDETTSKMKIQDELILLSHEDKNTEYLCIDCLNNKSLNVVIERICNICDNYDEDKYTLKYMGQYRVNNVRCGSFCEFK